MIAIRSLRTALLMVMLPGLALAQGTQAPLRLPKIFQHGLVLQRDVAIPVWGWDEPGASVTVKLNGKTAQATTDPRGEWAAILPAMPAGGPYTMKITAPGVEKTIKDVLIGDVWIASGQSNMEFPLANVTNATSVIAAARDSLLREFHVPRSFSDDPQSDLTGGAWVRTDPDEADKFSAVAYYFARDLRAATKVPIGIIHTSWGGSSIEAWESRSMLGLSDAAWAALAEENRARAKVVRDSLMARFGNLPTVDSGLVDGRAYWADPRLDISKWATIKVPGRWEQAGYPGMDGVAWYRTTFTLTAEEANAGGRLSLGMIDDEDITWLNGVEVGRTSGATQRRLYNIPGAALKDGENTITIRVNDLGNAGGLYGDAGLFYVNAGGTRRSLVGPWAFKVGAVSYAVEMQRANKIPTVLYNQMIHPLQRFPIKGVIWYQGESNAGNDVRALAYKDLFASLIQGWRREWQGAARDFPFLWVQLPNYGAVDTLAESVGGWAVLRASQNAALSLPNTGQAVTIDVGEALDLHPKDKQPVGERLARIARRVAYGETITASGPTYRSHTISDNNVIIEFDNVGGGLVSHTGENVAGFTIAGADGRWVWADARIDGNRVVVSSAQVMKPVAVRYAWSASPKAVGLFNKEGWPAAPFRAE